MIDQAIRAAENAGCAWRILHTICPDAIVEARLAKDASEHPAINRTVEMYREVKARFEQIPYLKLEIDTSRPIEDCLQLGLEYLLVSE